MSNTIALGDIGGPAGTTKDGFRSMLAQANPEQELELLIDSNGGSVFDGFAMYDEIKAYPGKTRAVIQSAAFSISSVIPLACDEVVITPNGYFMIHNPMADTQAGDDEEHESRAALLKNLKERMIALYSERTGKSGEEIQAMMKAETYFNAKEALALGLVDSILETKRPSAVVSGITAESLPQAVYASLVGGKQKPLQESEMSDSTPSAATVQEIKAACPKASSDFIVRCVERSLPIAQATAEYTEEQAKAMEELQAKNDELEAKVSAMEEEAKAKAEEMEGEKAKAEAEAKAKAEASSKRPGRREPVAQVTTSGGESAATKWKAVVARYVDAGQPNAKAVQRANRENPGLREAYLAEINS